MPLSPFYLDLEEKAFSLGLSALGVAASGAARTFDLFAQCVVKGQCADKRRSTAPLPDVRPPRRAIRRRRSAFGKNGERRIARRDGGNLRVA